MKQKRISYKVAKAIKEAGYPQESYFGYREGESLLTYPMPDMEFYAAPTYIDVWIWLWREKKVRINTKDFYGGLAVSESSSSYDSISHDDPEDAIIAAIEYLVDNDLIK